MSAVHIILVLVLAACAAANPAVDGDDSGSGDDLLLQSTLGTAVTTAAAGAGDDSSSSGSDDDDDSTVTYAMAGFGIFFFLMVGILGTALRKQVIRRNERNSPSHFGLIQSSQSSRPTSTVSTASTVSTEDGWHTANGVHAVHGGPQDRSSLPAFSSGMVSIQLGLEGRKGADDFFFPTGDHRAFSTSSRSPDEFDPANL